MLAGRRCALPPRVEHATMKFTHRGMRVTYECKEPYELAGNNFIGCSPWGHWNRPPPACVGKYGNGGEGKCGNRGKGAGNCMSWLGIISSDPVHGVT